MLAVRDSRTFPAGGGEMGALIRAFDWSRTPLGPIANWPQSLRTAVDIVLALPRAPGHAVGPRRHHDLQRCLFGVCRRAPPPAARLQGAGGLARGGRPQPPGHGGRPARGNAVFPRRAPRSSTGPAGRATSGSTSTTAPCSTRAASRPACWRSWWRRPSACAPRRRCATARRSSAPLPPPCRTTSGRPSRTASSTGSTSRCVDYTGARPGDLDGRPLGRCRASRRPAIARSRPGRRRWQPARCTRSSFACAGATAPIAGTSPAPCRSATRPARWCAGSAPTPTSTTRIRAERALREREADLARVQQIGKVGGRRGGPDRRLPQPSLAGIPRHPRPAAGSRPGIARGLGAAHPSRRTGSSTEQQFLDAVKGDVRDYSAEYRIVRPSDGQVRWIAVKAEIERDAARPRPAPGRRAHRHHRQEARRGGRARKRAALPPCLGERTGHALDGRRATASASTSTARCASSGASRSRT